MKDIPIIFGSWAIPKLLDGSKTMTRRLNGLQRLNQEPDLWSYGGINKFHEHIFYPTDEAEKKYPNGYPDDFDGLIKCPYAIGDRLWVKETWGIYSYGGNLVKYKVSNQDDIIIGHSLVFKASDDFGDLKGWRSPRFMPRCFSRITLEVVGLKAPERLLRISLADVRLEGCLGFGHFFKYWDSLYTKKPAYQWEANIWVWPIEFKMEEMNAKKH